MRMDYRFVCDFLKALGPSRSIYTRRAIRHRFRTAHYRRWLFLRRDANGFG